MITAQIVEDLIENSTDLGGHEPNAALLNCDIHKDELDVGIGEHPFYCARAAVSRRLATTVRAELGMHLKSTNAWLKTMYANIFADMDFDQEKNLG